MSTVARQNKQQRAGSRIGAVLRDLFGWVTFPVLILLLVLIAFICAVRPAHAQNGEATFLVPSKEEVVYPSVKLLHPFGTDWKKVKELQADFEKVGLQVLTSSSPLIEDCQVAVTKKGYRFVCLSKSATGNVTCKLGPVVGNRKETVELLGLYYRACPATPKKPWS